MPKRRKQKTRSPQPLNYYQITRWAGITVLLAFLVYRVAVRRPHVPPPPAPMNSVIEGQPVPPALQERFAAVDWDQRAGDRLTLWISVYWQRLVVIRAGLIEAIYPCSTAARGVGNRDGSNQTPLGWHQIDERIGDGLPEGAVFNERKYTGRVWSQDQPTEKDFVLSRILWLRGQEPGVNAGPGIDSHDRYIYIHGTPAEGKIGRPASLGCIRMKNRDVIELFGRTETGTPVLITEW
ncbi:MAG TPA: L,D-transpeptidase [Phycisphaerae bacterium]|nr:L,D-transpeptidase [Phycisphaerae bacterium]